MVSGPDMGAGFLWQLAVEDQDPGAVEYTFHLQDGGADAAGPPIGPPDFLDYHHPGSPCQFGGPRCWERAFGLSAPEPGKVRAIYNRTRFAFGALLAHQYEGRPVPFETGLERFLTECDAGLRSAAIPYRILGRGARWLDRPGEIPPSLQVEAGPGGASRLGELLEPSLIEPVGVRRPEEGLGGRAFLGTFQAGLRVDFRERPPGAGAGPEHVREVLWNGFAVPIAAP